MIEYPPASRMPTALERTRGIALPDGYHWTPFSLAEIEDVLHILVSCHRLAFGTDGWTDDELRTGWSEPGVSPEHDAILVRSGNGTVVGYEELYNHSSHVVLNSIGSQVLPEHRNRGIEDSLLTWAARRAEAECLLAPPDAEVLWRIPCEVDDQPAIGLTQRHGFTKVRYFLTMSRALHETIPVPSWPTGVEIRSLVRGVDEEVFYRVRWEAFQDHWGVAPAFADGFAKFRHHLETSSAFDPELFWGAFAEDRLVAICHCLPHYEEDPQVALVWDLGVLRQWRGRGLGHSLLLHAFTEFARRGATTVCLHVDASNPTGAVRLYERVGMKITENIVVMGRKLTGGPGPA